MQGWLTFFLLAVASLYGPVCAAATGTEAPRGPTPHIALLLPTQSPGFGRFADSVRQGVLAAAKVDGKNALPVRVYGMVDEAKDAVANYDLALADGARVVIGPMTRPGVNAIVAHGAVTVPTLALNPSDPSLAMPPSLYVLGLQAEPEARQVASFALADGRRAALVVTTDGPLSKRIQDAFSEAFTAEGGRVVGVLKLPADSKTLAKLKSTYDTARADMIFVACDAQRTRFVRAFADRSTPFYGTSQLYATRGDSMANADLEGARFLDMPWMVQPDHPAVMIYPRPSGVSNEQERFYALGIDAYRVSQTLLDAPPPSAASIDGVTGRIDLSLGQTLERSLTPAEFGPDQPRALSPARP
ncbi:MAG: penicillin-binding protein activator [Betaproteobacteria bacterium]|nr:penicillin-binding protein activator [Betaproteobacteria bacterium]